MGGWTQQPEKSGFKPVIDNGALHFRLTDSVTKPVFCVGIPEIVNGGAIYKIIFAIESNGQCTVMRLHSKLAEAARGFHYHYFLCGIGVQGNGWRLLGPEQGKAGEGNQ